MARLFDSGEGFSVSDSVRLVSMPTTRSSALLRWWVRMWGLGWDRKLRFFCSAASELRHKNSIPTPGGDISHTHPTDEERKKCRLEPSQATVSNSQATASKHRSPYSVRVRVRVRVGWSASGDVVIYLVQYTWYQVFRYSSSIIISSINSTFHRFCTKVSAF